MGTENIDCGRLERRFRTILSEEVLEFLKKQDVKARQKILFNIRKAEVVTDPELFKKLTEDIWEFRTLWKKSRYRLLAFWDRDEETVVVVVCGFIKKQHKVPLKELEKAVSMRSEYLRNKKTEVI